jgi:hypothetical protein
LKLSLFKLSNSVLKKNILATFSRQILSSLLQLIIVFLIAKLYGPEGNGKYAIAIFEKEEKDPQDWEDERWRYGDSFYQKLTELYQYTYQSFTEQIKY